MVVQHLEKHEERAAQRGGKELPPEEVGVAAVPRVVVRDDVARAVNHVEADHEQNRDGRQQCEVRTGTRRAIDHAPAGSSPSTSALNWRPRSSKSRNWSKLVPPGESTIASPGPASWRAILTASAREAARRSGVPVARRRGAKASSISSAISPTVTTARAFSATAAASSSRGRCLLRPPAINTSGLGTARTAASARSGDVAI